MKKLLCIALVTGMCSTVHAGEAAQDVDDFLKQMLEIITELRDDVQTLKGEVAGLKTEVGRLEAEIKRLKSPRTRSVVVAPRTKSATGERPLTPQELAKVAVMRSSCRPQRSNTCHKVKSYGEMIAVLAEFEQWKTLQADWRQFVKVMDDATKKKSTIAVPHPRARGTFSLIPPSRYFCEAAKVVVSAADNSPSSERLLAAIALTLRTDSANVSEIVPLAGQLDAKASESTDRTFRRSVASLYEYIVKRAPQMVELKARIKALK